MLQGPEDPLPPSVRISDADRQVVIDLLRGHCADGRITLDEFAERAGVVFGAKVRSDLDTVTADLPAVSSPPSTARTPSTTTVIGIMSGGERTGRWRAGEHVNAVAFWGGCLIDLRGAEIDTAVVEIDAIAIMGGIEIIVPEGIKVDMTSIPIMGGCSSKVKDVPVLAGTPLIKVRAVAFWGGISVRSRPSVEEERRRKEERRLARLRGERVPRDHDLDDEESDDMGSVRSRPPHHEPYAISPPPARPTRSPRPACSPSAIGRPDGDLDAELDRRIARHEERHRRRIAGLPHVEDEDGSVDGSLESVAEAVTEERPDLSRDTMPDGTVTILFTDIEDSTLMIERLGDIRAQDVIRAHNDIVRSQVAACGGHEVKSQGDSFMVSFAGARRGLRCAIGIQRSFVDYCEKHPEEPIRVRIGLHTGEAIREADDLFGKSVILAARIAAEASAQEILVSSLLKELTDSSGEFVFAEPRTVALKGLSGQHTLYPVDWREDDLPSALG